MTERSSDAPPLGASASASPAAGGASAGASPAVVATAGHVDHGKSSLVLRLTGMDPDRLEEEKRRGLTIELGFAWCTLPSGRELGFVDVPGHERFVRTMLAGVGPARLVLFVVAADEGWKPQSEEHLEIVDVLGVDGAVVALTKRDLVDAAALADARENVRERLAGTALGDAPVVACSSVTGEGIDELVAALDAMLAVAPEPTRDGRPRLHVDRVFSIRGSGTVVTGTLAGGPISVGDEVELLPSRSRGRIRGLQTHHRAVEVAHPVARVAANLTGVERERIERGEILALPGRWRETEVLEARIRPVRSLARALTSRGAFKLHAGAAERDARVRLLAAQRVPEDGAFARIALSAPLVLEVGDRFVLRESGRRETVAGGLVLDAHPPRRPGADATARLFARERASGAELPALLVAERAAIASADLETDLGVAPEEIEGATLSGGWWFARPLLEEASSVLRERLGAFHAADPLAPGERAAAVRTRVSPVLASAGAPRDAELADALIEALVEGGVLEQEGGFVRLAGHRPTAAGPDQARLVAAVREAEPSPPTIAELLAAGFGRSLIDAAVRSGELVRVSPELVLTRGFVRRAEELVRAAGARGITLSAVREGLGTSRRYAVPLMEHLDRAGVTRRQGDLRFARAARPAADA